MESNIVRMNSFESHYGKNAYKIQALILKFFFIVL
jgi:hypothetical protein